MKKWAFDPKNLIHAFNELKAHFSMVIPYFDINITFVNLIFFLHEKMAV